MKELAMLVSLVGSARRGVAFTGAGISTESGIPDFRSPGGVWSRHRPIQFDEFLASRSARARYWKLRAEMQGDFANAKPNSGHLALAEFERRGHLAAVITQNIDGLHQDAGSREVVELHGTNRIIGCLECGKEWPPAVILERWQNGEEVPDCDGCGGPLKAKTISFGQSMPEREMRRAALFAQACDVCLAIGSSLVVEPAASLPRLAKESGAKLVILNNQPTPLDESADLVIRAGIGQTLSAVLAGIGRDARDH